MSKADRIKRTEESKRNLGAGFGGRPIRRKGYYRALRSGKSWAVMQDCTRRIYQDFERDLFYSSNPFLNLLNNTTSDIIPIVYGIKEKDE